MNHSSSITIDRYIIGDSFPPYIVAEMACAHDGSPELAHRLVDSSADAGVDAIQLQILSIKNCIAPYHPIYELGLKLEISTTDWLEIIEHAHGRGLQIWANIFDESALDVAQDNRVDAIKLHSTDLSNLDLLKRISEIGKPVSLSTGGSTLDEISQAVFLLRERGVHDFILMHGFQAYPTQVSDSRIHFISTLKRLFNCPVGYQDHTIGGSELSFILPIAALVSGAVLLEKHITIDRSLKQTDYESALNPDELKRFVDLVHQIAGALDSGEIKPFSEDELKYRQNFKKSIVAARTIKKGELFSRDKLVFLRAGLGLPPSDIDKVVGCKSAMDIKKYATIQREHLEADSS